MKLIFQKAAIAMKVANVMLMAAIVFVLTHAIVLSAPDNYEYDEIEQRVVCHMRQAIFWSFRHEFMERRK